MTNARSKTLPATFIVSSGLKKAKAAGITSSVSLAQPAIAFLEDEFNLSKKAATALFAAVGFLLCNVNIFGLGYGVLDEFDFWGGTFCLVLFGTIETVLFGWVFGMDKAWTELHVGSDITIPRVYRFVIKYITPAALLLILGFWLYQEGWDTIMMTKLRAEHPENISYVLGTRILLLACFAALTFLVWISWRRRARRQMAQAQETAPEEAGQ